MKLSAKERTPEQKLFAIKVKLNHLRRNAEELVALGGKHVHQIGTVSLQLIEEIEKDLD